MAANAPGNGSSSQDAEPLKTSSIYLPDIASEIVEIRVSKTTMFRVHENVLRQSPFFANALKPEWADARAGKPIGLENEDADTFAAYVQWLYSHRVDPSYHCLQWAKNYVLGEKMMDLEFQDDVLETMMQACYKECRFAADPDTIRTIYDGTPEGSPARKFFVDIFCWAKLDKDFLKGEDHAHTAPAEFLNDLIVGLFEVKDNPSKRACPLIESKRALYMLGSRKREG